MSTGNLAPFLPLPDKRIALVRKIAAKTQEGKIVWMKTSNGATAYVPGALRMNFVEAPWSGFLMSRWVIFAVRDEAGNELLKVENQSSAVPGTEPLPNINAIFQMLYAKDPLVDAVTDLHNIVRTQEGKEAVDKALDILDTL
jgi:hypothetical protein